MVGRDVSWSKNEGQKRCRWYKKIYFESKIPTIMELAANLKGKLLLVTGDMDINVHPANTSVWQML